MHAQPPEACVVAATVEARPPIVLVMGVSGSGKSTLGALLARRLNVSFVDADSLHSPANITKMRSGLALTDGDRAGWLAAVAAAVHVWRDTRQGGVMACSALKRRYRIEILGDGQNTHLVYLRAPIEVIRQRLQHREGHFMPAALLDSQFESLEEPLPEEHAVAVDVGGPPLAALETLLADLCARALPISSQSRFSVSPSDQ